MSCVIDLYKWRHTPHALSHPSGVALPFDEPGYAELVIPELRNAIRAGTHCADLIRALADMVRAGDRALVIGSGLGILSTLIAMRQGVERVIAIEPNIALAPYIEHVHRLNGVAWVETVNAVPVASGRGRIPYFVRDDVRSSSFAPEDGPWRQVMLVPALNLNLILAEERISLIVAEGAAGLARLLTRSNLEAVDRMVLEAGDVAKPYDEENAPMSHLAVAGFEVERKGDALLLERVDCVSARPKRRAASH